MRCRDGHLRLLSPLIAAYLADLKEAWNVFGILPASEFQDLKTLVKKLQMGTPGIKAPKHTEEEALRSVRIQSVEHCQGAMIDAVHA